MIQGFTRKTEQWRPAQAFFATVTGIACVALSSGCKGEPSKAAPELEPALQSHVLDEVPSNVPNRTLIDFEGKVQLIGYEVEPKLAKPGSKLKLTLYWQSVSPLRPGWSLFTHVLDKAGIQRQNADNEGPLREIADTGRQALPPSQWQPGKVYVDEQEFEIDSAIKSTEIILAVGVWRGTSRLAVISGPADHANRGLVVHLKTGLTPPTPVARGKS